MEKILLALGVLILVFSVKMIFDARPIVKVYFAKGKENENVIMLKIVGFIFLLVGGGLIYNFL